MCTQSNCVHAHIISKKCCVHVPAFCVNCEFTFCPERDILSTTRIKADNIRSNMYLCKR